MVSLFYVHIRPLAEFILNLILLPERVDQIEWDRSDPRFQHVTEVLRVEQGSVIDFAVENGPRGKGTIKDLSSKNKDFPAMEPSTCCGFFTHPIAHGSVEPQTCRKVLEQATAMGVEEFHFSGQKKANHRMHQVHFDSDEWREKIRNG